MYRVEINAFTDLTHEEVTIAIQNPEGWILTFKAQGLQAIFDLEGVLPGVAKTFDRAQADFNSANEPPHPDVIVATAFSGSADDMVSVEDIAPLLNLKGQRGFIFPV